jgi:hypothetical protein
LVATQTRSSVVIPTPDASHIIDLPNYDTYYTPDFHLPKTLIKFSTLLDDVIGCLYNMTEDDYEWFTSLDPGLQLSAEDCESMIFTLDLIGSDKVFFCNKLSGECPSLEECKTALENYPDLKDSDIEVIKVVYTFWKEKRYEKNKGNRIRYILKVRISNTVGRYEYKPRCRSLCLLSNT